MSYLLFIKSGTVTPPEVTVVGLVVTVADSKKYNFAYSMSDLSYGQTYVTAVETQAVNRVFAISDLVYA